MADLLQTGKKSKGKQLQKKTMNIERSQYYRANQKELLPDKKQMGDIERQRFYLENKKISMSSSVSFNKGRTCKNSQIRAQSELSQYNTNNQSNVEVQTPLVVQNSQNNIQPFAFKISTNNHRVKSSMFQNRPATTVHGRKKKPTVLYHSQIITPKEVYEEMEHFAFNPMSPPSELLSGSNVN